MATLHDLEVGKEFDSHVRHMRPFFAHNDIDDKMLEALAAKTKPDNFVVEEIVDHRPRKKTNKTHLKAKQCEFFVHWEGYDIGSWEPFHSLKDTEALENYVEETEDVSF